VSYKKWGADEDELLKRLYGEYKGKWSLISAGMLNRSRKQAKNRYYFLKSKAELAASETQKNDAAAVCVVNP